MMLQGILFLALATGFAADDNAANIVGVWTASIDEEGGKVEVTMEFTKDGKAKAVIATGKKDFTIEGVYKLDKDKLILTRTLKGKEDVETDTIKELTKTKLVLVDDKTKKEIAFTKK